LQDIPQLLPPEVIDLDVEYSQEHFTAT
jgi:hypothetical protein